jgi:hypothetical protein
MSLDFTDIFCGAGGSSIGLAEAGLELKLAANHWDRAIETHSANFRDADHLCADVSNYDMRRLPRTRVLWASPICTENSPAGGRKRRPKGQLDIFEESGHVPGAGMERTRATFHDVIRAAEVHRYDAVIVENVTEAADWELWDWWLGGMVLLGYNYQLVSVSSAHVGGEDGARWQQHRLVLKLEKTLPWLRWTACDRQLMSQTDFAEFIEEHAKDLDPQGAVKAADLLEVAQEFHAHTTVRFTKGTRLASGQAQLEYTEDIQAHAGRAGTDRGTMQIPTEFDLAIWPYEDCDHQILAARFRYRIGGGDLKLGYFLNNPERVAQEAVASVVEKLAAECSVTVMYGQPA